MSDIQRSLLLDLAAQNYKNEADDDVADYSVHDALYDAAEDLRLDLPDGYDYNALADDLRYDLGMD